MCTILHDKIQWKKQQQQNKSWQNETAKTDQFQKQSKQETNKVFWSTLKYLDIWWKLVVIDREMFKEKLNSSRAGKNQDI